MIYLLQTIGDLPLTNGLAVEPTTAVFLWRSRIILHVVVMASGQIRDRWSTKAA